MKKSKSSDVYVNDTNDKFLQKCSTKTTTLKILDNKNKSLSVKELLEKFIDSYEIKFKNCVAKKFGTKCVKIYTNHTVQLNGIIDIQDILKIVDEIILSNQKYICRIGFMNWSVKASLNRIDLYKTMKRINDTKINGVKFVAFFLRSKLLNIRYLSTIPISNNIVYKDNNSPTNVIGEISADTSVKISGLLYASGSCTLSGISEKLAVECFLHIKECVYFE